MAVTFHRTWTAYGPPELVVEATAPARGPELHPLITAVSAVEADGAGERWTIDEGVPFGPFTVPNRYTARRERVGAGRLVLEAWSRPSVHLVHTLELHPAPEGTRVEHRVEVEAPAWVRGFVVATAGRAHDEWVRRVCAWVAAESERRGGPAAAAPAEAGGAGPKAVPAPPGPSVSEPRSTR